MAGGVACRACAALSAAQCPNRSPQFHQGVAWSAESVSWATQAISTAHRFGGGGAAEKLAAEAVAPATATGALSRQAAPIQPISPATRDQPGSRSSSDAAFTTKLRRHRCSSQYAAISIQLAAKAAAIPAARAVKHSCFNSARRCCGNQGI